MRGEYIIHITVLPMYKNYISISVHSECTWKSFLLTANFPPIHNSHVNFFFRCSSAYYSQGRIIRSTLSYMKIAWIFFFLTFYQSAMNSDCRWCWWEDRMQCTGSPDDSRGHHHFCEQKSREVQRARRRWRRQRPC